MIIAAADAERAKKNRKTLDAQEIADEIGVLQWMMAWLQTPAPMTKLILTKSDLMDMFKEMLVVDVNQGAIG